jgi:hypothetical protein
MSTTIFTFDHGQKDLNKAIGVEESYLEELAEKCQSTVKSVIFDEDRKPKNNMSPSNLVEICANEFSYSQLVILSSFFLNDKLDQIVGKMEHTVSKMKSVIMNGDDMPEELKKFIDQLIDKIKEDEDDI